jgi:hypothetical protein
MNGKSGILDFPQSDNTKFTGDTTERIEIWGNEYYHYWKRRRHNLSPFLTTYDINLDLLELIKFCKYTLCFF